MIQFNKSIGFAVALIASFVAVAPTHALYIPDKLFGALYTDFGTMSDSGANFNGNTAFFQNITPIPSQFIVDDPVLNGISPPAGEPGGAFERNEHIARFATNGETSGGQNSGHNFLRRESWDIAFDMKIESPNVAPRKEAGLYIRSTLGNQILFASTNATHYGPGPGELVVLYDDFLPTHSFSNTGGPLGDYNGNGAVDSADYIVWRDTLGSTTDFRANGSNEGTSLDTIDQADYDVWRAAFGQQSEGGELHYNVGDTLRWRVIYTPPTLTDPNLPDPGVAEDPNISAPGMIEYQVSLNGGAVSTSGPLEITNSWKGIPNGTRIMLRVQNLGTAAVDNDSSKVTFSNFDFNGDLPGSGLGTGSGFEAGVPEPCSAALAMLGSLVFLARRRCVRCVSR